MTNYSPLLTSILASHWPYLCSSLVHWHVGRQPLRTITKNEHLKAFKLMIEQVHREQYPIWETTAAESTSQHRFRHSQPCNVSISVVYKYSGVSLGTYW